ncbi:hypothetical protein ES703_48122 [subsurface metagenome]
MKITFVDTGPEVIQVEPTTNFYNDRDRQILLDFMAD